MDPVSLERLMLDRALGELTPDVEVLLDAYLQDHPREAREADRMARTVREAKAALAADSRVRPVPFPLQVLEKRLQSRRRWAWAGRITSLAACVMAGIGLHAAWMSRLPAGNVPIRPPQTMELAAALPASPEPVAAPVGDAGFWSMRRIYERTSRRKPESPRRIIWDSPLSAPRLGEST